MVAAGEFETLVALRAKQGEFAALKALSDGDVVQPLLELHETDHSPAGDTRQLVEVVRQLHGFGRLIMVDAAELKAVASVGGEKPGGLAELADSLLPVNLLDHPEQIPFIPVVRSGLPANQVAWIGRLCNELGVGGAIRVRRSGAVPEEVGRLIAGLEIGVENLDLILDLQYVDSVTRELIDWVSGTLVDLGRLGPFRSVTLLGGSVPSSLDRTALWERPRFEELLWRSVHDGGLEQVRLGDYGVTHPGAGVPFRSKHVAVKYTCPGHWLFVRERTTETSDRGRTLKTVCRNLAESDSFSGPEFSWGDGEISLGANGLGTGWGSTSKPVAIGTSHHLAYLSSFQAA